MIVRIAVRWSALVAGIAWGLLMFNSAVYRSWAATGPPNVNPEGWLFSSVNCLWWSASSFLAGGSLFVALGTSARIRPWALFMLAVSATFALVPHSREWWADHQCAKAGGSWSSQELRCKRA